MTRKRNRRRRKEIKFIDYNNGITDILWLTRRQHGYPGTSLLAVICSVSVKDTCIGASHK